MLHEIMNVDYIITGSELVALLIESEEIKKHKPRYNRMRKSEEFTHSIEWFYDQSKVLNFRIVPYGEAENPLLSFNTYSTARERLLSWLEGNTLCLRYCGLTSDESVCFNHQIMQCNGVCAGEEEKEIYNARAEKVVREHSYTQESFVIFDRGRVQGEHAAILVEKRKYAGYAFLDETSQFSSVEELSSSLTKAAGYPDADLLIRQYLSSGKRKVVSIPGINHSEVNYSD